MKIRLTPLLLAIPLFVIASVVQRAVAIDPPLVPHTFTYSAPAGSATVPASVAGDFNGWKADVNSMVRGADGNYSVAVTVTPGKHFYRIVYDGKWINDPAADKALEFEDGFGGKNSAFIADASMPPTAVGKINHTFRYVPPAGAAAVPVSVAADFNGWKADVNPMARGDDRSYSGTFAVPPGRHYYRIVYDGKWINDPLADKALDFDDGFGGKNSSFIAGDSAPAQPVVQPPAQPPAQSPAQSLSQPAAANGLINHTFGYVPPVGAATVPVSVAGDFNGWKADVNSMARGADGTYSVTVPLSPGKHYYRIVYDGKWINDPAADKSLEFMDGFGGKNSGVIVGPDPAAAPKAMPKTP